MNKEEKNEIIDSLAEQLKKYSNFYITDVSTLNVEKTNKLRRMCFSKDITFLMAKNTLIKKAMERSGNDYQDLFPVLHGSSSIMFSETANTPAKLIKEFRKTSDRPVLKGAYIDTAMFVGDNQLDALVSLKSKNELIGEIIGLLQSPAKNVISALKSGGNTIAGIVKTLSEKPE
jgi:large subunit ribosomal protein L10